MSRTQLLTLLVLTILAFSGGCTPFLFPAPTPMPFWTITVTVPTPPPPPSTLAPTPTLVPASTPSPRASATASRTSPPKAAATATRTPSRETVPPTAQPKLDVQTLLVAPGQPGRLYAFLIDQWATPLDHKRARLVVSDDMGATWSPFSGGLPANQECMVNVNLDYATTDALFASTCQGIYRWTGSKWSLLSDLRTRAIAVTYRQPNNIWAAPIRQADGAVARSTDGGVTWQSASEGMIHFSGIANIGIDPRDARTLYAIIMPKYAGSYLRRKTGDNQWETMPTPLNNSQIDVGMTIDGATGALYTTVRDALTNLGQGHWQVWRSSNPTVDMNSIKWEKVYDFGELRWATMLASGWSPQGLALYARVTLPTGESTVLRSLDSGKSWTTLKIP